MRITKSLWAAIPLLLSLSWPGMAEVTTGQVQLKSGEMALSAFLEMVSDKLDIQIDASGLDSHSDMISVPDAGPVSIERARELVITSLYLEGYTWIQNSEHGYYRVLRLRDARDQETPIITAESQLPDSDLLVTYAMSLENASPDYVARNMRSFMPANSRIIPDEATNSILITDSAHNIFKLKKLVQKLDTPQAGKEGKERLAHHSNKKEDSCQHFESDSRAPGRWVPIALFSLVALVIGFLARGYVIRRIEGGL